MASACHWFLTEVRRQTILWRCRNRWRTSRSPGDGTQIRGNRFATSKSRIWRASRSSVFCFRTIAARISAASPHPKLVSQLGEHPFEPLRVAGCFHTHPHWPLQPGVKRLRLTVAVLESALQEFARFHVYHRNLLEARMKIASYNQHTRLLSFRVLVSSALPSLLGSGRSRRCYLINNALTRCQANKRRKLRA